MENKYFNSKDKLHTICCKYPETIAIFVSKGFKQLADESKRELFGKSINLEMALKLKKINLEVFSNLLFDTIEQARKQKDSSLNSQKKDNSSDSIKIQGLLPCPVRIPLTEGLDGFIEEYEQKHDTEIIYDLKAASMGLDWLVDDIAKEENTDKISDIFISAGFDLFFDKKLMGKFKDQGVFIDSTKFDKFNTDFDNEDISLQDPDKHYSILATVPAVFLVNTKELGDREMPRTWADLFKPEFKNSVSLPISDFDLFNSILLHIYKQYGSEGVKGLGRCLLENLHPAQMVKSNTKKTNRPTITIMPYFFTKMVKEGGTMKAVWPEDGAIISPIFMLTKKDKLHKTQDIIDFFTSDKVAKVLSHQGLFPSVNPNIDNRLKKGNKFMWLGWDYINNNDIASLITKCEQLFKNASMEIDYEKMSFQKA